jgi:ADP-heptose:LPS heptosyltransferase
MGYAPAPGDEGELRLDAVEPASLPPGYVVVHPGASVPARAWGVGRHAALVGSLSGAGWPVVVTGGPGEEALTAAVAGAAKPAVVDLGGETTFAELAGVLAGARVCVTGNTGPAHLAAAVGTPVVSIYAPTVPATSWRPWMVSHELLSREMPCAGCRAKRCPIPGHPCMSGIAVDAVVEAVHRLAGGPCLAEVA